MRKTKLKRTLDKKPETKRPKFVMAEPNDDIAAFGWDMGKLRYPSTDSKKGDVWPGRSIYDATDAKELDPAYGHNIEFICAKFVQTRLDRDPAVRKSAEACRTAKYSSAALDELAEAIHKAFVKRIVPEMIQEFEKVSRMIAEFYAARLAHIDTFGFDED
jgi:hypothetical protein